MRKVLLSRSYTVSVTIEEFQNIMQWDKEHPYGSNEGLYDLLEQCGCKNVNYDGCFGTAIFFTLDVEDDIDANWKKIRRALEKAARGREK